MKGLENLKERLPDYQGKGIFKFIIIVIITFLSSIVFQLIMDSIPRIFRDSYVLQILEPLTPIFGSLIILIIGFLLVYSFWRKREKYLMKNRATAYQSAFKFVVTGVPMVISMSATWEQLLAMMSQLVILPPSTQDATLEVEWLLVITVSLEWDVPSSRASHFMMM